MFAATSQNASPCRVLSHHRKVICCCTFALIRSAALVSSGWLLQGKTDSGILFADLEFMLMSLASEASVYDFQFLRNRKRQCAPFASSTVLGETKLASIYPMEVEVCSSKESTLQDHAEMSAGRNEVAVQVQHAAATMSPA